MTHIPLRPVLQRLRRLAAPAAELSDGHLLERFRARNDEAAFALLVRRHGPMVLGVCRRVLRQEQDAEDAFQATFLVLARKAGGLAGQGSVGGWLYEVASRTARKVRATGARRRARERQASVMCRTEVEDSLERQELRAQLDEELRHLPEKYRAPVVLCYLEEKSHAEAAALLGWPVGTVKGRLARARERLRSRLLRRGVVVTAAAVASLLTGELTAAAVPAGLGSAVVGGALPFASGTAAACCGVSVRAVALAEAVARSCAAGRLPLLALAVVLAALGAGAGLLLAQPGDEGPTPTTAAQPGQASPPGLRSRLAALRERLAARGGGTARSEAAVAAGLDWLARHQAADGHWSLDGFAEAGHCDCTGPGGKEDVAATAFGLLPFLGAGITHRSADQPRYAGVIEAGLAYLRRKQTSEGEFRNTRSGAMDTLYSHALATMAVCEAYGLTGDPALREPARRALDLIVRAQDPRLGGWRYRPGNGGDTSVTGWQVQALRRGDLAGLRVPKETLDGAIHWLDSCESPDGGYGYTGPRSTPTTTAVGLLCRQYLGWGKRGPTLRQGLMQLEPAPGGKSDLYYEYYATQVLANVGGPAWQKWNARVRDQLVSTQDRGEDPNHRHAKGSWFPAGDKYANAGGRLMLTALALRTLEVYYDTDLLLASRPPRALKADDLRGLWADLGSEDVPRARPALWALVAAPELALPFLKDHVPPADVAVDRQRLERAAAALDDDRFAVRKQAMADLEKAGDLAEPVLRKLLEGKPSVEARRRAEELLDQLAGKEYTPERRRARLAVEVLELTDTAQARELLEALARGTPEARLTREAKAALGRLGGKP